MEMVQATANQTPPLPVLSAPHFTPPLCLAIQRVASSIRYVATDGGRRSLDLGAKLPTSRGSMSGSVQIQPFESPNTGVSMKG